MAFSMLGERQRGIDRCGNTCGKTGGGRTTSALESKSCLGKAVPGNVEKSKKKESAMREEAGWIIDDGKQVRREKSSIPDGFKREKARKSGGGRKG